MPTAETGCRFIDKIDTEAVTIVPITGRPGDYPSANAFEVIKSGSRILLSEEDWDRVFTLITALKATR